MPKNVNSSIVVPQSDTPQPGESVKMLDFAPIPDIGKSNVVGGPRGKRARRLSAIGTRRVSYFVAGSSNVSYAMQKVQRQQKNLRVFLREGRQIKSLENIVVYSYLASVAFGLIAIENRFQNSPNELITDIAKGFVTISSVTFVWYSYIHMSRSAGICSISRAKVLLLFLMFLHPAPFVHFTWSYQYTGNRELSVVYSSDHFFALLMMMFRTPHVVPMAVRFYLQEKIGLNSMLASWNYVNLQSPPVILRAIIKNRPIFSLLLLTTGFSAFFGYMVMVSERGLCQTEVDVSPSSEELWDELCGPSADLTNYFNAVWLVWVTMTTVGECPFQCLCG
jgi:hypothetical protein